MVHISHSTNNTTLNNTLNHHDHEEELGDTATAAPVANYQQDSSLSGLPAKQGLYDPEYEKDACGVGKQIPRA